MKAIIISKAVSTKNREIRLSVEADRRRNGCQPQRPFGGFWEAVQRTMECRRNPSNHEGAASSLHNAFSIGLRCLPKPGAVAPGYDALAPLVRSKRRTSCQIQTSRSGREIRWHRWFAVIGALSHRTSPMSWRHKKEAKTQREIKIRRQRRFRSLGRGSTLSGCPRHFPLDLQPNGRQSKQPE